MHFWFFIFGINSGEKNVDLQEILLLHTTYAFLLRFRDRYHILFLIDLEDRD